ncbi:MAG TPA: hypothetical protein VKK31_25515 [Thermoanaerobaculia bacterium]|nr:hypothetical protein [Thermoanaerobaculia bacterium]
MTRTVKTSKQEIWNGLALRTRRSVERQLFFRRIYRQTVTQELLVGISSGFVISHQLQCLYH